MHHFSSSHPNFLCPHTFRFNVSVDQGNYISLRAFLGTLPIGGKLQDLIRDENDADLPSVENFLEGLTLKSLKENLGKGLRGGTDRVAAAVDVGVEGEQQSIDTRDVHQRRLNVYAKDQRTYFDPDVYPDRTFGKLMFPASYYCTGQLIGKR